MSAPPSRKIGPNSIVLLDVDGTITEPRKHISADMMTFLEKAMTLTHVGLVSGSDLSQIQRQMDTKYHQVADTFEYVFSQNGLVAHKHGQLIHQANIVKKLGENKLQEIINFSLATLSDIWLPCKRGLFIELRTGLINVCPVGHTCNEADRESFLRYNETHHVLEELSKIYHRKFPELSQGRGGQISFDLFPNGWDKRYCLQFLEADLFSDIHFFGNRTDQGGNDYELFNDARTTGYKTSSPEETKHQMETLLNMKL